MKIYHIEFAKTGTAVSGGETWMLEVVRYLQSQNKMNVLLTTDNGEATYKRLGFSESETLQYKTIASYRNEQRLPMLFSYFNRTFLARALVAKLQPEPSDVLICHSDFFPNTIPFNVLAHKQRYRKMICMFHMMAPSPLHGFEGQFTGRTQVPKFKVLHYKLNQWLYFRLIPRTATIITSNSYYLDYLKKKCPGRNIVVLRRFAGAVEHVSDGPKSYDLIWMGRFHPQKGLLELPAVLELVKRQFPNVTVAILGSGDKALEHRLHQEVSTRGLAGNIKFPGFVMGDDKYRYLSDSKVFLMTSLYESFGIVCLEAMKNGLPVVAYDLPVYSVFRKGMIKVPVLDREAMASEIIKLLKEPKVLAAAAKSARRFAEDFSWNETGKEVLQLIETGV